MKSKLALFVISAIIGACIFGWIRIANMPAEVIQSSLEAFRSAETVDEVKVIAPLNQFAHSDLFTAEKDAGFAGFTFPIADLLYSIAWVDITAEPIIVSVPEMGDRYYAISFTDLINCEGYGDMLRDMWKVGPHEWFDHTGTSLRRVTFEISGHFLGSAASTG